MTYLDAFKVHKTESDRILATIHATASEVEAEDISEAYGYSAHEPETESAIARLEEALSASVPPALRLLYMNQGGFEIFDRHRHLAVWIPTVADLLRMRYGRAFDPGWPSLYSALVTYGSRREFDDHLSPPQIEILKQCFVFGMVNHRYEDKTFLCFSATGALGKVRYEHDFSADEWDAHYLPLFQGRMAPLSIDELLEPHIRACTDDLRQRFAEDSW